MPILRHGIVLEATDLPFEVQAVLNPGCIWEGGEVHVVYRAVRPGNYSSIGYCRLRDDAVTYRSREPILYPEFAYERHGLEDPRLVRFTDGTYYLFYTAYDGESACICYATARELPHFTKRGIISPLVDYQEMRDLCRDRDDSPYCGALSDQPAEPSAVVWDKDGYIFPRRIEGKIVLVHRLWPVIQLAFLDDLAAVHRAFWSRYLPQLDRHTLLQPRYSFEQGYIGGGCPPIETEVGWLFIYHAVETSAETKVYHAAAALLDRENPRRVIGRLPYPLFSPETEWEKNGDVANVVFPTGAFTDGGVLHIYYGAADSRVAHCSISLDEVLSALLANPENP
jgi:predicted GH43/DUF377 family glycosyl hydrolase